LTYPQTLAYLYSQLPMYQRIGPAAYKGSLEITHAIDTLLKHPHKHFRSIHVAGTNGKGSVSHLMASVLQEAGYKTGLYTSPHLKDFRERIRINGKKIKRRYITQFIATHKGDFERIKPSFFEMTVGLAFSYFAGEGIDVAVIETGLGGRLDSTNIITPDLSVITNISFDHMNLLGNTLSDIAREKAGIIKERIPVVVGETQEETSLLFKEAASSKNSAIFFADKDYFFNECSQNFKPSSFISAEITNRNSLKKYYLKCPLTGIYQHKNIVTSLCAIESLIKQGYQIDENAIRKGYRNVVSNTQFMGRWQILARSPLVLCDTGHNSAGISEVIRHIDQIKYKELHVVFGMVNDKDRAGILSLLPKNAHYYFCRPDIPRGLDAEALRADAMEHGLRGKSYSSTESAFKDALQSAGKEDMVYAGGSTFVVAEVLQIKF